ncbi:MAG: type II secretion system secretin GspD [Deltaproteobacteria bacterium]|nr:type II secretion system secretin GspD [Deltaproteobacteria bacterium]
MTALNIYSRRAFFQLILLLFLLFPALGIGQEDSKRREEGSSSSKPAYVTMNFKDVDLQVFIKFISELSGKNFLIDPNVKGTVTIVSPQKVTIDEVYQVFLSVLEVNGFTTVEAGQVVKIIPTAAAKTKATDTVLRRRVGPQEDKIITQLIALKNADATFLGKLLASLVERTGLLIPYPATNTIIVIDTQSNINRLVKIIMELDVPGDEEIWVVSLSYAKADDLAKKLLTICQEKKTAAAVGKQDLKIMADERTNSLVVLAASPQMARIRMLVEKLDQSLARSRENIHIYSLQNAVAEDLAQVLVEIPGKGTKDEKVKAPPISKDVQITADKATNSLVIIAEPEEYAILMEVIKKLDEARAMVYVEALIMEVSATKAMDLGVEWRLGNEYDGGYGEGKSGGVWFGGARGDTSSANEIISTGTLPAGFMAGVIGRGITLGSLTFPTIAAFVRAVKTDTDFNIISTPQILTLDNEEASIEVGQNIPFVTRVDLGDTTDSRAIQNFEYKDVGVTLKVTPQINEEGFIRLQVEESIKAVLAQTALGGTVLAPTTAYRTAKTSIIVQAGETAVIGGLISTTIDRDRTQTPCLGKVPAFGWLFRATGDRDEKTNLMVFLTPHVVRDKEEARRIYEIKKDHIDRESEKVREVQKKEVIRKKAYE